MSSKGGSAPAVPDYKALAEAQAKGNLDLAKYVTSANRINQITPYGSLTYTNTPTFDQSGYDAALAKYNASLQGGHRGGHSDLTAPNRADFMKGDNWTATQTLTPAQQAILESGQKLNQSKLGYAQNILDKANAGKGGIDMSSLPSYGINPGETYSDAIMRRLAPQQAAAQQAFDSKMANQGVVPGTQAYDNAYRNFVQGQNDQLTSAITGGMGVGLQANQQAYNQAYQNANLPINQINALQGGSQVQNPNFVNSANMPNVQGADLVGAAQNTYNAQLANYNAQNAANSGFMGGLMNLGGAIGSAGTGSIFGKALGL